MAPENSLKGWISIAQIYFALPTIMNGKTNELNTQGCASNKETALHALKDEVQGLNAAAYKIA
jgi:hypothetical protein